jgi:hypothetical protein
MSIEAPIATDRNRAGKLEVKQRVMLADALSPLGAILQQNERYRSTLTCPFGGPTKSYEVEIAPNFTDADWRALDLTNESHWLRAIEAFRLRIDERFLKPVRAILSFSRSGFAILALDCLLVETIEQAIQGVERTPCGNASSYFRSFLERPAFRGAFDDTSAELFRDAIRNGILHQAEVKGSSLVRRDGPIVQLTSNSAGVIVNPVLFHYRLEDAFQDYIEELKQPGSQARQTFRCKMEFIGGKNPSP